MKENMCILTASEVCDIFRITRRTLDHWMAKGVIRYAKVGGKLFFRYDDVNRAFFTDNKKEKEA
jgi:excisionase family DNA binding protein